MKQIDLKAKIEKVKILVMDIDGTLTDSSVFYSKNGEELKRFSLRDGMGIELLHKSGIKTAFLTSENSPIVIARATKLKIGSVMVGSHNKRKSLEDFSHNIEIPLDEIAYCGDDVNDILAMEIAVFTSCPSDATEEVQKIVDLVLTKKGGMGAVRELCEIILKTQNKPITLPENW